MKKGDKELGDKELVERLVSTVPSKRQLEWQKLEYYNFIHFGINTFAHREWTGGNVPPSKFNPKKLDTDQWVRALKASGSRGVILTAKHHDGFCLFPSKFTEYSIKNSPYKGGNGDIVAELAESCKKYGFKFGLYLSPWDRNNPSYGTPEYNDYFVNQLTELCTNYGEIFCFWFDGACGEGKNGKKQVYDFPRYFETIRKYQPDAVTAVCGTDVRWIGNEGGHSRKSEWSVVSAQLAGYEYTSKISQQEDNKSFVQKTFKSTEEDLGSREALKDVENLIWYPAEMDVSIYRRWFHYPLDAIFNLKTIEMLCGLYYESVGGNSALLLNVPPNKKGLIPNGAVNRLKQFGDRIREEFANPIPCRVEQKGETYSLKFEPTKVSALIFQEDITKSQRIEGYDVYATVNGVDIKLYDGTTVGWKKICKFTPIYTDNITIKITACRKESYLINLQAFS